MDYTQFGANAGFMEAVESLRNAAISGQSPRVDETLRPFGSFSGLEKVVKDEDGNRIEVDGEKWLHILPMDGKSGYTLRVIDDVMGRIFVKKGMVTPLGQEEGVFPVQIYQDPSTNVDFMYGSLVRMAPSLSVRVDK